MLELDQGEQQAANALPTAVRQHADDLVRDGVIAAGMPPGAQKTRLNR